MQAPKTNSPAALLWLDRSHAFVARATDRGTQVTEVERELDAEPAFLLRVAREAAECDRVVVMGPDASRIAFERQYVALYRRPDRIVDVGIEVEPQPCELADRLRILAAAGPA